MKSLNASEAPPPMGDNRPPAVDPAMLERAAKAVSDWADAAGEWLDKGEIADGEHAGHIKDMVDGARKIAARLELARGDAKKPHLEAGRAVDKAFKTLVDTLDLTVRKLKPLETAWLKKMEAIAEAERKRKAQEAAAAVAEAARLAQQAQERNDILGEAQAAAALEEAQEAAVEAAKPVKVAIHSASGGGGKATSLRALRVARITNLRLAFTEAMDVPAVRDALQSALNAKVRSAKWPEGGQLLGCTIETERTAA